MVNTCSITATARDSTFALRAGQRVVFRPDGPAIAATGGTLLVRTSVIAIADALGALTANVAPGTYVIETLNDEGLVTVPCRVPDQAAATIAECIDAMANETYTALQLALLSLGLPF